MCLFDDKDQEVERLEMVARSGNVWHIFVPSVRAGQAYGFRAHGPFDPENCLYFSPEKLLLDPYAQALTKPAEYHRSLRTMADTKRLNRDRSDSGMHMPKGVVVDHGDFDWRNDAPLYTPWTQTVLYETHVKGISMLHPDVPEADRGTYLGMASPVVIEHLKSLGITAVQLMPVHSLMPEPRLKDLNLTNYWGYNPINWFAPEPRYAIKDPVSEFKILVRTLHEAGIEVILDVVYNHTAEADLQGPTLSQTGLFPEQFYRFGHDGTRFINDTGCGNTVNLFETPTLKLVMDSLRFWVDVYHVDGFRFDLAVTLGRERRDFSPHSAFFKAVAQDPVLSRVKLIAEPWDIGPGGYQLGNFPDHWYECNDRYRDTVRGFWRGDSGLLPDFCTRLMGSRDLLQKGERAFSTSLNYVTYHDGFTLQDLVSYEKRHNEANGEHNRDGHGHNLSANYGVEGPSTDPEINALRAKQKRNMLATLLLSQGAVHLLGGDEISRTQQGNNNAYCQDNEINWYQWRTPSDGTFQFLKRLIELRQSSSLFHDLVFTAEELRDGPAHNDTVHWYNTFGQIMTIDDWHNSENRTVGLLLSPAVRDITDGLAACGEYVLWLINAADHPCTFQLPTSDVPSWPLLFDTGDNGHQRQGQRFIYSCDLEAKSMCLLGVIPTA